MKLRHDVSGLNAGAPDAFDIRVQGPDSVGTFIHVCPNRNSQCGVAIRLGESKDWWHGWDGNFAEPTITPSIGCDSPPRCGWHGSITKGERTP